jgi:protein-disulfide isomerase
MTDLRSAGVPPLRADDHVRGAPDAPLAVVYADFTCPRCAVAHLRLRDAGTRVVFRHFALRARHPRAEALATAAEAAAQQGAFWALADALYADQGRTEDPHLWALATGMGLDLDAFELARRSEEARRRVRRDVVDGMRAGVTATPTLFVAGEAHPGAPDAGLLDALRYSGHVQLSD